MFPNRIGMTQGHSLFAAPSGTSGPAASASPQSSLEMRDLRAHPMPAESTPAPKHPSHPMGKLFTKTLHWVILCGIDLLFHFWRERTGRLTQ